MSISTANFKVHGCDGLVVRTQSGALAIVEGKCKTCGGFNVMQIPLPDDGQLDEGMFPRESFDCMIKQECEAQAALNVLKGAKVQKKAASETEDVLTQWLTQYSNGISTPPNSVITSASFVTTLLDAVNEKQSRLTRKDT